MAHVLEASKMKSLQTFAILVVCLDSFKCYGSAIQLTSPSAELAYPNVFALEESAAEAMFSDMQSNLPLFVNTYTVSGKKTEMFFSNIFYKSQVILMKFGT